MMRFSLQFEVMYIRVVSMTLYDLPVCMMQHAVVRSEYNLEFSSQRMLRVHAFVLVLTDDLRAWAYRLIEKSASV
jgi:hypothetical protein